MKLEIILPYFAKVIEREIGIVYAEHNYFQLQNRLEDIAKSIGAPDILKLYEMAQNGISGSFKQQLLDVATNNETSFFRDIKVFRALESEVLANIKNKLRPGHPFRIWSAASSTGQEALSIVLMIKEWSKKHKCVFDFNVLGTDISDRALARAKNARYSRLEVQRGLPEELQQNYFEQVSPDTWAARPELMAHVSYRTLNLKEAFSFSDSFDLILCRNVLIYQSLEGKKEILKKITSSLSPGGYLVMGSGESLLGLSDDYQQTAAEGAILYKKINRLAQAA